jgi:general secretion pathway protein K
MPVITSPRRQRGVALLVALLVVALAVILIAALLDRGELAFARTRNALRSEQADAYAQGLETYAAQVLFKAQMEQPGPDTSQSAWALPLPPQPVPGGVIVAKMRDLNGCFNLNNLSPRNKSNQSDSIQFFDRLLTNVGIGDAKLGSAVRGWLGDSSVDVATSYYLSQPVAYRPRGDLFAHVSELRLVVGVTEDVYARLAPYLCALPPGTKINLNTAAVPILQSVVAGMSTAQATALWNSGQAHFESRPNFVTTAKALAIPINDTQVGDAMFAFQSTYFLARGDIVLDDVPFTFYSLIERWPLGPIRVLARSRGSDDTLTVAAPIAPLTKDDAALD